MKTVLKKSEFAKHMGRRARAYPDDPPFVPAARMLAKALAMDSVDGVALLLRLRWLTGQERWRQIYARTPPTVVAPFVERVPMVLGGYDPKATCGNKCANRDAFLPLPACGERAG